MSAFLAWLEHPFSWLVLALIALAILIEALAPNPLDDDEE